MHWHITHIHVHMDESMYIYMYLCVCIYVIWMYTFWHVYWQISMSLFVYAKMSLCIYPYMFVYRHACIYVLHTHILQVSSVCSHLSNFRRTESLDLHLQRNTIGKQFSYIRNCYLLPKVFMFQVLWSSHQASNKAEEGTS